MKKTVIILFALLFACSFAHAASFDSSAASFEDLQNQLDTYNLKLWQTGNWSSVIVPDGTYIVGMDIPAGSFSVRSATIRMGTNIELFPAGCDMEDFKYEKDPRYINEYLKHSDSLTVDLIEGDKITISLAGTQFIISDYTPRFVVDPDQEAAVHALKSEYSEVLAELKSRQEWREVPVPEGIYKVGEKIPAAHWTIWPKGSRSGVHYGENLDSNGNIFYSVINSALKDSNLSSFEFGYHEGWVSINMQDGWYVKLDDDVIFTPYIGTTPFQFNE